MFLLVMFGFFIYAIYRQYQRGERGRAILLGLAILLFLAANIFDSLVDIGVIDSIYIIEFAYLAIVIAMSLRLSREVTTAESELQKHQNQ